MARYQPGDLVHVASFGKGIVREVRNSGRYLVEIKGRAMEVAASQLSPVDAKRANRASSNTGRGGSSAFANASANKSDPPGSQSADGGIVTLDLHGHTVEEALEALEQCLNDALLTGTSEIHVIHGKSGGRIKTAVHRWLAELAPVRQFRLHLQNAGVTVVRL